MPWQSNSAHSPVPAMYLCLLIHMTSTVNALSTHTSEIIIMRIKINHRADWWALLINPAYSNLSSWSLVARMNNACSDNMHFSLPMKMLYFAHENNSVSLWSPCNSVCPWKCHYFANEKYVCQSWYNVFWPWKHVLRTKTCGFGHWNLCLPMKILYFAHENMFW